MTCCYCYATKTCGGNNDDQYSTSHHLTISRGGVVLLEYEYEQWMHQFLHLQQWRWRMAMRRWIQLRDSLLISMMMMMMMMMIVYKGWYGGCCIVCCVFQLVYFMRILSRSAIRLLLHLQSCNTLVALLDATLNTAVPKDTRGGAHHYHRWCQCQQLSTRDDKGNWDIIGIYNEPMHIIESSLNKQSKATKDQGPHGPSYYYYEIL